VAQTERILKIQQMLRARGVVSKQTFLEKFEISDAAFKRDLAFLRDRFQIPIKYDASKHGYVIVGDPAEPDIELPGPMYTASEILALLAMQDLICQLQPGLLDQDLAPLRERLRLLLSTDQLLSEDLRRRIRLLHMASRPVEARVFREVSQATLSQSRLHIRYYSRARHEFTERDISPQRLVYYRGNWYIDAWCHLRTDLRSFSVDAIESAEILKEHAQQIGTETLDRHLGSGYGIFAGPADQVAVLRFAPEVSPWVAAEHWHSKETKQREGSGHLLLSVPYANEQELVMDILRYIPHVQVMAPDSLRNAVRERINTAFENFGQI
jgi:predicted DNA-binding transcriptional regulator YafY